MARGVDIVVATPGRLLDHLDIRRRPSRRYRHRRSGRGRSDAGSGLHAGDSPHSRQVQGDRQTVLLSATMPAPIRRLADEFLSDPLEISVAPAARPIELIDQKAMHMADRPCQASGIARYPGGSGCRTGHRVHAHQARRRQGQPAPAESRAGRGCAPRQQEPGAATAHARRLSARAG